MANLRPVSRQTHGGQVWRRLATYSFAAKDATVPITMTEMGRAVTAMPMAFMENAGQHFLVAVLSLTSGRNLYVAPNGKWMGMYIPILYRLYPFRLLRAPQSDQYSLFVDEEAQDLPDVALSTELFYDADGNLSAATKAVMESLTQFEQHRLMTVAAVAALAAEGVICPWPIKIRDGDQERTVGGLHRVDEVALGKLSDEAFLRLRKAGALAVAYAQLLSMGQVSLFQQLSDLYQRASQLGNMPAQPAPASGFVMTEPESLRFD